jgi:hypothetical protein
MTGGPSPLAIILCTVANDIPCDAANSCSVITRKSSIAGAVLFFGIPDTSIKEQGNAGSRIQKTPLFLADT